MEKYHIVPSGIQLIKAFFNREVTIIRSFSNRVSFDNGFIAVYFTHCNQRDKKSQSNPEDDIYIYDNQYSKIDEKALQICFIK